MQKIVIKQSFRAPLAEIFSRLADHEKFGRTVGAPCTRIAEGKSEPNGRGSVRRINKAPFPAFEETITDFRKNEMIEYKITRGSPLKNHTGCMLFSETGDITTLHYTIEFEPKLPIPFLGYMLERLVESPIRAGIEKMAGEYR